MHTCTKCVLDERFPGIRFGEDGLCNFCRSAADAEVQRSQKDKCRQEFAMLAQNSAWQGHYDCLVAYSGGKDSTYTLHLLKGTYDLRILAFSYDNWFQSPEALQNIRRVIRNMNVDHLTVAPSYDTVKCMTLASLAADAYPARALTRASCVCTSCIALIRLTGLRLAVERRIPMLVFGMSPGQAPIATGIVKTNVGLVRAMQAAFLRAMNERVSAMLAPFMLEDRHFAQPDGFPYIVNPLAFTDYDEGRVFEIVRQYGWNKPDDTDSNSTNCLLNAFANHVHITRFGVNPYASEIAELVRAGSLTREEGLRKLSQPPPIAQVTAIKEELGIT